MSLLDGTIAAITQPDAEAGQAAARHLDELTKPRGSLGRLEEIVQRFAAIRRDSKARCDHCAITVFVADHGVAEAGVSAYPKAVTLEMLRNIAAGGAAINVLARRFGYRLLITDVGVERDTSANPFPGVRYRRFGAGTCNLIDGPAMSIEQAEGALECGIETAVEAVRAGAALIGIGEMGIGNSTSAAALLCALTAIAPARIVGRGTGIDDHGLKRKLAAVETALAGHRATLGAPRHLLAALGGFEIAAMAGVCLGGAAEHVPVVVDGFIATAAAALAVRFQPSVLEHLFFSHCSAEGGHRLVLEALAAKPILDLDMRLGEGTGAALAMNVIQSAVALHHEMATFASARVSRKLA